MNKFFLFTFSIVLILTTSISKAQSDSVKLDSTKFGTAIAPEFKGDYMQFLRENIRYPKDAMKKNIQGKVFLEFVIDKEGKICDLKISKSVYPSLDIEALRVVALTKWKPAYLNGEPVRFKKFLAIVFAIPE